MKYKPVKNRLRVVHIPQVPMGGFVVDVHNEREAYIVSTALADQHFFLYRNGLISDYDNVICIEMYNEEEQVWEDYYNEEEDMEWEEFETTYLNADE